MSVSPRVVGGLALGGAILLAWQDERARGTVVAYAEDGTLREDWALVPIAQRAIIAERAGWSGILMDGVVRLPVTSSSDADRVTAYWRARLRQADTAAGSESGSRLQAFDQRIRGAKRKQGAAGGLDMYADRAWVDLPGPLNNAALIAFWGAINSAATTVHAVLSQLTRSDARDMFREIGSNFAGTIGELLGRVGGFATELAAEVGVGFVIGVLSHPLVLGAAGLAIALWFKSKGGVAAGGAS